MSDNDDKEPGFKKIGDLLPKIVPSPSGSGLTPTSSATSSETSGSASQGRAVSSSTGKRPSAIAAAKSREELQLIATGPDETASRAAVKELLLARLGCLPEEGFSSRYASDGQFESELTHIILPHAIAQRDLHSAWGDVMVLCEPAFNDEGAQRAIVEEWSRLKAVTISRAEAADDSDLATDTILDELEKYPADCVLRALRSWRNGRKWRPALAEILAEVQWRARYRMCLRAAFEKIGVA